MVGLMVFQRSGFDGLGCWNKTYRFNGVYQPSFMDTFPTGKVLLLSYFYDRATPLIPTPPAGTQPQITVSTFAPLAQ